MSEDAAAAGEGSGEATYGFAAAAKILDIPEARLRHWSVVGFVGPSVRRAGKQLFTFQDLVGVKAAKELTDRGIKPAQIHKALTAVRAALPHIDRPLDRLRVAWSGESLVVVDEDGAAYEPTGQKVFDFGLGDLARRVSEVRQMPAPAEATLARATAPRAKAAEPEPARTAYEWFREGVRLEDDADPGAADCYRRALAADPGLAAAHTNLGNLAHRRGDGAAAREAFEAALALDPEQPEARFNLANIILEAGDLELAVAELRRVLQVAPDFADAHFNLAVALERLGGRAQARKHLESFLGLAGGDTGPWLDEARTLIARLD